MTTDYNSTLLIDTLLKHSRQGLSLLEIGMGSGKDLDIQQNYFQVKGSDLSDIFLDLYRSDHPQADLIKLNAVDLATERKFDILY